MNNRAKLHRLARFVEPLDNLSNEQAEFELKVAINEKDYITALNYLLLLIDDKEVRNARDFQRKNRQGKKDRN